MMSEENTETNLMNQRKKIQKNAPIEIENLNINHSSTHQKMEERKNSHC